MKKIVVLTATRAEYGLLAPVIKKLDKKSDIDVRVAVTGSHLSPDLGMTVNEIREDGVKIDTEIDILVDSDFNTEMSVSKTMGAALTKFAEYFEESKPDALMVLGDRYEVLAVCMAAVNARIPIIHLHGGEATEGAIDEYIRNAITKLSYLHFTSTDEYRNRVIQMGEDPERVFKSGATGVENAMHTKLMTLEELEKSLGHKLGRNFAVLTFHPVTTENNTAKEQAKELLEAVKEYSDINFICTKANADAGGRIINECLEKYARENKNILLFDSLGVQRYLSAVSLSKFVIGNSSSGIIEVPSFKIPTINIGDRQKGRIQAKSVINCNAYKEDIIKAIEKAISNEFLKEISDTVNPYGDGNASGFIADTTTDFLINNKLGVQKSFYNNLNIK